MISKAKTLARLAPGLLWRAAQPRSIRGSHVLIAVADHFEPTFAMYNRRNQLSQQREKLSRWCHRYPAAVTEYRDAEGFPFRHSYFLPAEDTDESLLPMLVEHCEEGWGEIEIHLHHGVDQPGNAAETRRVLTDFRDLLVRYRCLSQEAPGGPARYVFVHGNWCLANSGKYCGVDEELQILAETGCYADMTLPSAPDPSQITKMNSLHECTLPLHSRAAHRKGRDLTVGRPPKTFPIIIQGPLSVYLGRDRRGIYRPRLDNAELSVSFPGSLERLVRWARTGISVRGNPDWIFVKLHCHGMDPKDSDALTGDIQRKFLKEITENSQDLGVSLHFVTAREMVNIALAACNGREGNPADFRDYRFKLIRGSKG
jgi:hypothetical protein